MSEPLFELIFAGEIATGYTAQQVREVLENLFEFDRADADRLFSGEPIVLGGNMNAATTESFRAALAGAGAHTSVQPVAGASAAAAQERRENQRRQPRSRRARLRSAAILPDRRAASERRG